MYTFKGKQTVVFVTKKDKDQKVGKKTVLTVNWDGLTEDEAKAGYLSFMVVKLQGSYRTKGIPDKAEVRAKDYAPGQRHSMTPEEAFASLSEAERAKLVAKYAAKPKVGDLEAQLPEPEPQEPEQAKAA